MRDFNSCSRAHSPIHSSSVPLDKRPAWRGDCAVVALRLHGVQRCLCHAHEHGHGRWPHARRYGRRRFRSCTERAHWTPRLSLRGFLPASSAGCRIGQPDAGPATTGNRHFRRHLTGPGIDCDPCIPCPRPPSGIGLIRPGAISLLFDSLGDVHPADSEAVLAHVAPWFRCGTS